VIHNTNDIAPNHQSSKHHANHSQSSIDYKEKLEKQQQRYDELLRECEKYRTDHEQLIEYQIELENLRKDAMKYEKRHKLLSDQIVELTYNNVQLEKEINDYSNELDEQRQHIDFLQHENQKLMTKKLPADNENNLVVSSEPNKGSKKRLYSSYGHPDSSLGVFVKDNSSNDANTMDLKRRLSVQLRDNFGYNEKFVMFANAIDENGSFDGSHYGGMDGIEEEENNLFTMVQNYQNNEEYLTQTTGVMVSEQGMEDIATNGTGTDHGDAEREESLSELSEKHADVKKQITDDQAEKKVEVVANPKKETDEEEKAGSMSPLQTDNKSSTDLQPLVLANKSREEKALDPRAQRKGSKSSSASGTASPSNHREYNERLKTWAARKRHTKHDASKRHKRRKPSTYLGRPQHRETDALDEYLHLTASAVKINYPTVNATSEELIEMVRGLPFYQAHDHLNRYMMDRLRWEQIQQNKLLQLKAAAIQSQRDHQIAQQSTVTRLFKKWFTTEYDDMDHILGDQQQRMQGSKVDLSAPLSKTEGLRVNRVGKAQMTRTKSGGRSVNLGSLNPTGIPPKGTDRKRRVSIKSRTSGGGHKDDASKKHRKRKTRDAHRDKKDGQLKSMAITQTLPSSKMNDKNVQRMLAINAEYIDKVVQNEADWMNQKAAKPTIKITVPVKSQGAAKDGGDDEKQEKVDDAVNNAEEHAEEKADKMEQLEVPNGGKIKEKKKRKKPPQQQSQTAAPVQTQQPASRGLMSWIFGTAPAEPPVVAQPVAESKKMKKSMKKPKKKKSGSPPVANAEDVVPDPYALATTKKKRRSSKDKKERKSRKSKSPQNPRGGDKEKQSEENVKANDKEKAAEQEKKEELDEAETRNDDDEKKEKEQDKEQDGDDKNKQHQEELNVNVNVNIANVLAAVESKEPTITEKQTDTEALAAVNNEEAEHNNGDQDAKQHDEPTLDDTAAHQPSQVNDEQNTTSSVLVHNAAANSHNYEAEQSQPAVSNEEEVDAQEASLAEALDHDDNHAMIINTENEPMDVIESTLGGDDDEDEYDDEQPSHGQAENLGGIVANTQCDSSEFQQLSDFDQGQVKAPSNENDTNI